MKSPSSRSCGSTWAQSSHAERRDVVWKAMRSRGWEGMSALDVRHCVEAQLGVPMDALASSKGEIVAILSERAGDHDFGSGGALQASPREALLYLVVAVLVGWTLYSWRAPTGLLDWVWVLFEGAFWWYVVLVVFGTASAALSRGAAMGGATDEQIDESYGELFPDSAEGRKLALGRWRRSA